MTNYLQDGAEITAMVVALTGLSAGGRRVWRGRRDRRATRRHRNWHGYIAGGTMASWYVRIAEEPDVPTCRVVLEVLGGPDGAPDSNRARSLRLQVQADRMLARVPTPNEYEFLKALSRERGYGNDPDGHTIQ